MTTATTLTSRGSRRARGRGLRRTAATAFTVLATALSVVAVAPAEAAVVAVDCSGKALVAAINQANSTETPDTLHLAAGCTYELTTAADASNGLPVVLSPITVEGNGATITRPGSAGRFRILEVAPAGTLTLNHVTISGGEAVDCPGPYQGLMVCGSGIHNHGRLTLHHSRLVNHILSADILVFGAGLFNEATGTATLNHSEIGHNAAAYTGSVSNGALAGGVANEGSLTIANTSLVNNEAWVTPDTGSFALGAALISYGPATITDTLVADNVAVAAGGVASGPVSNVSAMTIHGSRIADNRTSAPHGVVRGGGIASGPASISLDITSTEISRNTVNAPGGFAFGGAMTIATDTTLTDVQLIGNVVHAPGGRSEGGGIQNRGTVELSGVRITHNTAEGAPGYGGGLYNGPGANVNLIRSAVTANTAATDGGGIFDAGGTVTMDHTTVAGNRPNDCTPSTGTCT